MNGYAFILIALVAYLVVVVIGRRFGLWKGTSITFYGPVMMLRTKRGRRLMTRAASPRRFWTGFGTAAVIVTIAGMCGLTGFLVWQVLAPGQGLLSPEEQLSPPHTNLWAAVAYMILGLSIAVLAHELMHGVLAVVGNIRVESIGILVLLLPVGAFVEPNDPELKAAPRSIRLRLFSAGPATNLFLGAILAIVLIGLVAPSATPVLPYGAVVTKVTTNSPAFVSGIEAWSEVTSVGGTRLANASDFQDFRFVSPGGLVSLNLVFEGRETLIALPGGVVITDVMDGPALNAGIRPGMIVSRLDGNIIHSSTELVSFTENATHEGPVDITVLGFHGDTTGGVGWFVEEPQITQINLTSKWLYYATHYPSLNREVYRNQSVMGATFSPFGLVVVDPEVPIEGTAHPFRGASDFPSIVHASVAYFGQPFLGYSPVVSPAADLYEPSGLLSPLPRDVYWTIVNLLYWVFWANLVLGLTNALPAVPMDGGLVLEDLLKGLAKRSERRLTGFDKVVGRRPVSDTQIEYLMFAITFIVSILILYLILLRFI